MRLRFLLVLVVAALAGQGCGSSDGQDEDACFYRGQVRPVGADFPAGDGCNTCTCNEDLSVACTEVPCPDADIPDAGPADGGVDAGDIDAGDVDAG
jgi:hypothetical protein